MDNLAVDLASQFGEGTDPIKAWTRFLDNIFILWVGASQKLHEFINKLNQVHPTIKFTFSHTTADHEEQPCNFKHSDKLAFLDIATSIIEDQIVVDLYKKPTDRCQYLLTSSCHPPQITENIPFSLAYRIVRICSEPATRDRRVE